MRLSAVLLSIALSAGVLPRAAAAGPALLFDPEDGKVLYAEDPDNQWHPASLTKIMTAYLAFDAIKSGRLTLETPLTMSATATKVEPSKLGLKAGEQISVDAALQALIIKSANDVAVMLAETIGGTQDQFVALMNATAARLGMSRTHFVNPNGLPTPAQITTARDLAKLARSVVREFPQFNHYWGMQEARIGKILLTSHNGLLKTFEGADGLKTGFICDSGYNVVASASRDGKRLMAVVLGEINGKDRTLRAASLLEHGFQQMGWKQIFNPTTIDNMAMPPEAKGIISMRQSVATWECGTAKPGKVRTKKKLKPKIAKAAAGSAGAGQAGTVADKAGTPPPNQKKAAGAPPAGTTAAPPAETAPPAAAAPAQAP